MIESAYADLLIQDPVILGMARKQEMKKHTVLTVIDGKRDEHEKQFQYLLNCPHKLDDAEFDRLLHKFKDRLGRAEQFELVTERIRKRKYADTLEQKALLAVIEGRQEDAEYYQHLLKRRRERGFRVVPSGRAAPTQ